MSAFNSPQKKKSVSSAEALAKIYRYCAYQERSHQEVQQKLFELGLRASEVDELMARLITEGFLNEERFAKAFAGGKFRMKKWGKIKIQNELEALGLSKKCIERGMKEIVSADYRKTLKDLVRKKAATVNEENAYRKKDKIARFVIGKGFEPELVWEEIKSAVN